MKITALLVLGGILAFGCLVPAVAQEDFQALPVLYEHVRPRWKQATYRQDRAPTDDLLVSLQELELKKPIKRPALVLVYSNEDEFSENTFEQMLFQHPHLVLAARAFACIRLDVQKNPPVAAHYEHAVPRFLVFDEQGRRRADISMVGYRHRSRTLFKVMLGVVADYGAMPLDRFVKEYWKLLQELVPIETALQEVDKKESALKRQSGSSAEAEKARLAEERREIEARKKAWRERERAFLKAYHHRQPTKK